MSRGKALDHLSRGSKRSLQPLKWLFSQTDLHLNVHHPAHHVVEEGIRCNHEAQPVLLLPPLRQ